VTSWLRGALQSWDERAGAGAAGPQEGLHPEPGGPRGGRPRRPGEHAQPGLLQGQGQAEQGPAVTGVSGGGNPHLVRRWGGAPLLVRRWGGLLLARRWGSPVTTRLLLQREPGEDDLLPAAGP